MSGWECRNSSTSLGEVQIQGSGRTTDIKKKPWIDVLPAPDDDVLAAADDLAVTVWEDDGRVARVEPAVIL